MANRHTLHVDRLGDFERWLSDNGWEIEEPKGDYEVLRARKPDRKRPLILWRRLSNNGGGELTHLTYDDRDGAVIFAFLLDRKKDSQYTVEDLLLFVQRTGGEISIKPVENADGAIQMFTVRLTKWLHPTHGDIVPWAVEATLDPLVAIGPAGVMKMVLERLEQQMEFAMRAKYHEEAERRKQTE